MKTLIAFLTFFLLVCGLIFSKDNSVKKTPALTSDLVSVKDTNVYAEILVDNNLDTICVVCSWQYLEDTVYYGCDTILISR